MREAIDNSTDAYVVMDNKGDVVYLNKSALTLYNIDNEPISGVHITNIIPELASLIVDQSTLQGEEPPRFKQFYSAQARTMLDATLSRLDDNVIVCLCKSSRRQTSQGKAFENELRFQTLLESVIDGIVLIDGSSKIILCNEATQRIFGYSKEELCDQDVSILIPHEFSHNHNNYVKKYLKTGEARIIGVGREVRGLRKDGSTFPLDLAVSQFTVDDKIFFVGVVRDISERKRAEEKIKQLNEDLESRVIERTRQLKEANEKLENLAYFDPLTGLANRTLFRDRLNQSLRHAHKSGTPVCLIMMDLDRFKQINDTLGHHIGDLLLPAVGERIKSVVTENDTVARLGGDEFALILPNYTTDQACILAQRIIDAMSPQFILNGYSLSVKGSMGIAIYPDHGIDEISLFQHADVAMYDAKYSKGGYSVYDASYDPNSRKKLALDRDLNLDASNDNLKLVYHPVIQLKDNTAIAMEALMRWPHNEFGNVPPSGFIPIAEQTGSINAITYWAIDTALKHHLNWKKQGVEIKVAINISPSSLSHAQFAEAVERVLSKRAVNPNNLILELTESSLISASVQARNTLDYLAKIGVNISIDNYGSGYSSLNHIKTLPINELKIDHSFIRDISRNHSDKAIVESTLKLAHDLNLNVVAEGVETQEVYEMLMTMGCDRAQGFFYTEPLSPDEVVNWNKSWRARKPSFMPA